MPSFEKVGTLYGKSGGTPLCQEFHYKPISTWIMRIRFLLSMSWLLTRHGRWWLQMSLINQYVQLWNLVSLLRFASIEGFMMGTTLFRWPWGCMAHSNVIWIISLGSVFVFSMIDNQEVIYPCLFAFSFLGNLLVIAL
jgi:hypothetical protein